MRKTPSNKRPQCCLPAALLVTLLVLGGCAVGPDYQRPSTAEITSTSYKELHAWTPAAPADALDRGPWWTLFNDPDLNQLAARIDISNQNVAAASAAYAQARALVVEQRASLFPVVALSGSGNRAGNGGSSGASGTVTDSFKVSIGASWEPDVWGRLNRAATSVDASAQASAADLASARLAAQGELAVNYFSLRQIDAQKVLLDATIAGYQRSLQITQNRYAAGIAPKTDVLQAQTQLANAQSDALGLNRQRAQLEHAIAVLVGQAPGNFSLAAAAWKAHVPTIPAGVPSTLLQRRPDIAAAERRVAVANEQIGIATAAFYPSFGLNASYGSGASRVADLFNASSSLWSLGVSVAQTLFNSGATRARVTGTQAAHDAAVARYRQVVLTAFQNIEDQLAAGAVLTKQEALKQQASQAADQVEAQVQNRYRAGQVGYTEVVTAQTTALNARRALVQVKADRQIAAVALIQSLGGGWREGEQ